MGESVTEMLQFLCRLCARKDNSCVNVFSSDGDKYLIQKKIRLCLPVIVEEHDEMPRQICLSCLNKLEATYEFYTTCIYAQSTIQRLLKAKSLHDGDHVNKPGSEMKENIPTSFSLDQYLKRKIDPVDTGKSSKVQRTDRLKKDLTNNNVHVETTKASDTEVSAADGNNNGSVVTTKKSELQCASTAGGNNNICLVDANNSSATLAETQKPKLRVRTTSELRQAGQTTIVTDSLMPLVALLNSPAQSATAPTTRQSTCVSVSQSTSVVLSQSAVPQGSRTTSSFPQLRVKSSSDLCGGTIQSPVAQNTKTVSSVAQLSKNSSTPQSIGSSPSVLRFSTSSSSALQTATSSLSAPQNAAALLPVPKNATASLNVAKNATVAQSVPQNVTNSSSLQQYSLSAPTSLSSGCKILPKVPHFIIVPNTFASTPTFTAAGTNTVTVLAQALPSNVSLVGDSSVPLGQASTLVAPQPSPPPLQPLTVSTTAAVPLAPSSLSLVQAMPLQVTQQLPNPVMAPLTSVVSQSSTSGGVTYSALNSNSQELVISSHSRVTATTSTATVFSKVDGRHSTVSQNLKVSSSSPVGPTSSAPAMRVGTERKIVRSRSDTAARGTGSTASTVLSKQNGSTQSRTNAVTVSRAVSHPVILPKPAAPVVTSAKTVSSNTSSILHAHLVYTVPNSKKRSSVKPAKTTSEGSSSRHSDTPTTVLSYSTQLATKANRLPTDKRTKTPIPVSLTQATVVTPVSSAKPTPSVSVEHAQQQQEGARTIVVHRTYSNSSSKKQLSTAGAVSSSKTESQCSENQTPQKTAVPRPKPSGGLPPPPPTVPLNSVSISENRRKLANSECADSQNGEATSPSSQSNKSGLTPKARGPVATATVSPFTTSSRPTSDPQRRSPEQEEVEVELVTPSSKSPAAAGLGRSASSPSAAEVGKEECPYCHVVFPADLLIHHKALHYREKFYTCIDCDKNFVTEKGLESHRCQKESKG